MDKLMTERKQSAQRRNEWLRYLSKGIGVASSVAMSSVAGAFCLSLVMYSFDWLFFRQAVESGQYGWTFIGAIPTGAALGAITGLTGGLVVIGKVRAGGSVSIAGGCLLGLMLLDQSRVHGLLTFTAPYFLPLLWAALLIAAGVRILKRSPGALPVQLVDSSG